jgi:hypothetical protein
MPGYKLTMNIFDAKGNTYDFGLDTDKFRVDGALFKFGGRCYVPIFPHNLEKTTGEVNNDWYMGSHALVNEVIVYDNSPYVENGAKNAQIAIAKSVGIANKPTYKLYGGNPADSTDKVHDNTVQANILADSSVYTPDASVNPMIAAAEMKSFYTIGAPPTPDDGGGGTKPEESWLHHNIVLVIVIGVVGFMVLAALLYCLCCKANKQGYQNALYDEDSSMKARIQ